MTAMDSMADVRVPETVLAMLRFEDSFITTSRISITVPGG